MKKRLIALLAVLTSAFVLSACTITFTPEPLENEPRPVANRPAPTPVAPVTPNFPLNETMNYQCSNARLGVRYTGTDSAQVFFGEWRNLTRGITTSGNFVYRNDTFTWRVSTDGRTGQLEENGRIVRSNCKLT